MKEGGSFLNDETFMTAIHIATVYGHKEILEELIKRKCDFEAETTVLTGMDNLGYFLHGICFFCCFIIISCHNKSV